MGQLVRAAPFGGINDYIDCGNDSSLNITDEITVSAWAKFNVKNNYNTLVSKWKTSLDRTWNLRLDGSIDQKISLTIKSGGVNFVATGNIAPINQYIHFIGTYDGEIIRIYENGNETGNNPSPSGLMDSDGTAKIIIAGKELGDYFNGDIDDIRIYNRALSTDEISLLYNSYRSGVRI